ncbi:hypothetical protein V8C86DRAFT_1107118 [Haematococcus lacustris]
MVPAMFHSALEALLHHDSVRSLNGGSRQTAAQREHIGAAALCGASWHKRGQLWEADVRHHGRRIYLGGFEHEEHAAKVHDLMAIKLRGMHTPLNFVPETYNGMYKLLVQVDQAHITHKGRRIYLGSFKEEEHAAKVTAVLVTLWHTACLSYGSPCRQRVWCGM